VGRFFFHFPNCFLSLPLSREISSLLSPKAAPTASSFFFYGFQLFSTLFSFLVPKIPNPNPKPLDLEKEKENYLLLSLGFDLVLSLVRESVPGLVETVFVIGFAWVRFDAVTLRSEAVCKLALCCCICEFLWKWVVLCDFCRLIVVEVFVFFSGFSSVFSVLCRYYL